MHRRTAGGALLVLLATLSCWAAPQNDVAVFTSTRCVTGIAVARDGSLWAATRGGILHRDSKGDWRKFTVLDGLPSNEAQGVRADGDAVVAVFPTASAAWRQGRWDVGRLPAASAAVSPEDTRTVLWRGKQCRSTLTGIEIREAGSVRSVPLPKSSGTHVSALLPRGEALWAAMFGDGIYSFDGKSWSAVDIGLPAKAREITALAASGKTIWIGTRREGLFEFDGGSWKQRLQLDEPYDHNCQALALYRGEMFASTLEDGLLVHGEQGWRRYGKPEISSDAPRQMAVFCANLYVRHGNGKVDRFDGARWTRDVCSVPPRGEASALAADQSRLYVGRWGGWSEFDGQAWTHHLDIRELQGVPVTAFLPDGDTLWVGTQGRGLAQVNRATGEVKWHDERNGLPDDWVKNIARVGHLLYVGTFVGGLAWWDGSRWRAAPEFEKTEITSLAPDASGGLFIAVRKGVWRRTAGGDLRKIEMPHGLGGPEFQAVCLDGEQLWIGSRTGVYRWAAPGP